MCSQPCIGSPVAATLGRLAITTKMRMIWTTRGMLRSVSMNTLEIRLTIQLLDSRPTPTSTPSTVATRIPPMESRSVLTIPTHRARPPVSGSVSMPELTLLPGSMPRNP